MVIGCTTGVPRSLQMQWNMGRSRNNNVIIPWVGLCGLKYVPMRSTCSCFKNDTERDEQTSLWLSQAQQSLHFQQPPLPHRT